MANYEVHYHGEVLDRDLPAIPRNVQERILRAVEARLRVAPDRYGNRLRKSLLGLWRMRVGDYRIIYEIEGRRVRIWLIAHRKKAYEAITGRWRG